MATLAKTGDAIAPNKDVEAGGAMAVSPAKWGSLIGPEACFWIIALLAYGLIALNFARGHFLDQTSRDLWQHLAALKALIDNPFHPANPFIVSSESSRHFHPYWVTMALIARAFGWNEWQALGCAGFVNASILITGIWTFGRAYYQHQWGPAALLAAMLLSWSIPMSHTGFHSPETLLEGIGYPAPLLIGLSLLLWALTIRALERPRWCVLIVPLAAFMFASHQLGAGVGFVAASCFILFWPVSTIRSRALCIGAFAASLLLAGVWPYFDPFTAVARTGNATWQGGASFYDFHMLLVALFPSLIGIWGLLGGPFARRGRPIVAALILYSVMFALGAHGVLIGTRFLMPAILMMQIGVGALILFIPSRWHLFGRVPRFLIFALTFSAIFTHLWGCYLYLSEERLSYARMGSAYDQMLILTRDLPDREPVAALDVSVWPMVATGQRAMSVPWPEPMIGDLAQRQHDNERLFDPGLTRGERQALARRWGVRTMILDRRGPQCCYLPVGLIDKLKANSAHYKSVGPFIRFDL